MLDDLRGSAVECVSFKTLCCEPEPPSSPKLQSRTVSSITVKWNVSTFLFSQLFLFLLGLSSDVDETCCSGTPLCCSFKISCENDVIMKQKC